jgi:ABC-2 type transport system permease protein
MSAVPVTVRAVRDRWVGMLIAVLSLGALLVFAMFAYAEVDLSVYTNLPEGIRSVMGIPADADAAGLAYEVMLGTMAALTLGGLAVSYGASAIAGEERNGTIGLLLANPQSRTQVLVAKTVALLALVGLGGVALWGAGLLAPSLLGADVGSTHVGALVLHLTLLALFHGFLALAIGAWTGRRGLASGIPAAVLTLSFFLVGILPLLEATEGLVGFIPWDWFDGSQPLLNGVAWDDVARLGTGVAAFFAIAVIGVRRRDLRSRQTATSLVDALRAHPLTRSVAERLAGGTRVSSITAKTAADHQGLLVVVTGLMFGMMGLMMGPMYAAMGDALAALDSLPEEMLAAVGGSAMTTPEGFYQSETLGLMAPIAVILVGTVVGARAVAGEERDTTMGLLLANPITRARVLWDKAVVMLGYVAVVGLATAAGIAGGSALAGLGIDYGNILAAGVLQVLLGWVFGGLALLLGAATGRVAIATYGTVGAALVLYVVDAFAALNPSLEGLEVLSPFHLASGSLPLESGMPWGNAAVLLAVAVVFVAAAFPLFQRRDLRQR